MIKQETPNLSLGDPPGRLKTRTPPLPRGWLLLILFFQVVTLVCLVPLWRLPRLKRSPTAARSQAAADAQRLKAVAANLEERSLDEPAARAWQSYLEAAPEAEDRAEILYRVGKLYMQAEKFADAAAALVWAEVVAEDDRQLKEKIGPRLIECLRRLGMYGEVDRELSRQVEAGAEETGKGKVLAKLAGEDLTDADLDRMIERRVDRIVELQQASGSPADRQAMLKHLSTPDRRRQLLQEMLQTELLCRRARELKLDRQEEFLQARRNIIRDLLASRFLAAELKSIQPTDVDIESFHKANPDRYQQPESIRVVSVQLEEKEDAAALLEKIKSADDFRKLAAGRDKTPKAADGQTKPGRQLIRGRADPVLGNVDGLFKLSEGQWTKEPHIYQDTRFLVLLEKKTAARTPPLSEVKGRVVGDYVARKRQERSEKLFGDLMNRYDVRIVPEEDKGSAESEKASP